MCVFRSVWVKLIYLHKLFVPKQFKIESVLLLLFVILWFCSFFNLFHSMSGSLRSEMQKLNVLLNSVTKWSGRYISFKNKIGIRKERFWILSGRDYDMNVRKIFPVVKITFLLLLFMSAKFPFYSIIIDPCVYFTIIRVRFVSDLRVFPPSSLSEKTGISGFCSS